MKQTKTICTVGLGYIGLPSVDVVHSTAEIINQGKIHIVELELDTFVGLVIKS